VLGVLVQKQHVLVLVVALEALPLAGHLLESLLTWAAPFAAVAAVLLGGVAAAGVAGCH
jgi:hypothetical protein